MICVDTGAAFNPSRAANLFFNLRIEVRKCPDGAADLPDRYCVLGAHEALAIASHLVEPESESQSERSWFSVNAVRASDLWRVL